MAMVIGTIGKAGLKFIVSILGSGREFVNSKIFATVPQGDDKFTEILRVFSHLPLWSLWLSLFSFLL